MVKKTHKVSKTINIIFKYILVYQAQISMRVLEKMNRIANVFEFFFRRAERLQPLVKTEFKIKTMI